MVDGFESLKQDHRVAERLFAAYEDTGEEALVRELCAELTQHAEVEEEVFYPALRSILAEGAEWADRGLDEQAAMQSVIARIQDSPPADLSAPLGELRELFDEHVRVEEEQILPKMRDAGISPDTLGTYLEAARNDFAARTD